MDLLTEIANGNTERIKELLSLASNSCVDINSADAYKYGCCGCSALMSASSYNLPEIVKLLLDLGADVNYTDGFSQTALIVAETIEIMELLLNRGADINHTTIDGDTVLIMAVYDNSLDKVKFLVEKGANIHAEDDQALRVAIEKGHSDIIEYLTKLS